jgi:hypothetical protein
LVLLLTAACATHPLDIPDDEWETLTADQRRLAAEKEAALQATAPSAYPDAAALGERRAEARAARVERRRQRGRLGDSLDCTLRDGMARFGPSGWTAVAETPFRIVRGDRQSLSLAPAGAPARQDDGGRTLALASSESGLALRLCGDAAEVATCVTVAAPWHDMKDGMTWDVAIPETLVGVLRCAFTPGPPISVWDESVPSALVSP